MRAESNKDWLRGEMECRIQLQRHRRITTNNTGAPTPLRHALTRPPGRKGVSVKAGCFIL